MKNSFRPAMLLRPFLFLILCLGLGLCAPLPSASAQNNYWQVQGYARNANASTYYVLWVQSATDSMGNTLGDKVSVWALNGATFQKTSIGPTYGPYAGWTVDQFFAAPDGTLRMLWIKSGTYTGTGNNYTGDQISIWKLDTTGHQTSVGPTYGPYSGWSTNDLQAAPDGSLRMLWEKRGTYDSTQTYSGSRASIWKMDTNGNQISIGPTYGPFTGWSPDNFYLASDSSLRMLWVKRGKYNSTDGTSAGDQASIWKLDTTGHQLSIGPTYGPFPGWYTYYIFKVSDDSIRMLWIKQGTYDDMGNNYTGDQASIWKLDTTGHQISIGPTYGPYAGWNASEVLPAPDDTLRMLWLKSGTYDDMGNNYTGDQISLWKLDTTGHQTAIGPSYGPYMGWEPEGFDITPDGTLRMPWTYVNDSPYSYGTRLSGWVLNSSLQQTTVGPTYGPFY